MKNLLNFIEGVHGDKRIVIFFKRHIKNEKLVVFVLRPLGQ